MVRRGKSFGFIIIFCICTTHLLSQMTIGGVVRDNQTGDSIELASVILSDSSDSLIAFDITDNRGLFSIDISKSFVFKNKVLAVNHLSYNEKVIILDTVVNLSDIVIEMVAMANELKEVSISAFKYGIVVNGDTTQYSIESFASGHEKSLSEVLNRLPGIVYDDHRNITFVGRTFDKVLIEGDDLMNHDRGTLLDGLLISDVKDIQVIDNYSEQSSFKDQADDRRKLALNIKLKESSVGKQQVFIEGGYGYNKRHNIEGVAYRFESNTKYFGNVISNNIGRNELTLLDYINIEGGFGSFQESSELSGIPTYFKNQQDASEKVINYSSFTFSKQNKITKHHAYLLGINNKRRIESRQIDQVDGFSKDFFTQLSSDTRMTGILGKYRMSHDFSNIKQLSGSISFSFHDEDHVVRDSFSLLSTRYNTDIGNDKLLKRVASSLDFTHQYSDKSLYVVGIDSKVVDNGNLNTIATDRSNECIICNTGITLDSITQELNQNHYDFKAYIQHSAQFGSFFFPTIVSFNLSDVAILNSSSIERSITSLSDSVTNWRRKYWELKQGVTFKRADFSIGGFIRVRDYVFRDRLNSNNGSRMQLLPHFSLKYSNQGLFGGLTYKTEVVYPEMDIPYNSIYFQDIDRIQGNRIQIHELINKRSLLFNFGKIAPLRGESLFVFGQYSWNIVTVKDQTYIDNNELYFFNLSDRPLQTFFVGTMYDKKLYNERLGYRVKIDYLMSEFYALLNQKRSDFNNKIFKGEISLYSRYDNFNWKTMIAVQKGIFNSQESTTTELNYIVDVVVLGHFFSESLLAEVKGKLVYQNADFGVNTFPQLGLNVYMNIKNMSDLKIGLESNNLLQFNSNYTQSVRRNGNVISYLRTSIIPSYIVLQLKYQF